MIAYHVDSCGTLPVGKLNLSQDYSGFDPICKCFCEKNFPDGISRMGKIYTLPHALNESYSTFDMVVDVIEFAFEFIRQKDFPDLPSRYQSIFAAPDESAAKDWAKRLAINLPEKDRDSIFANIKKIEYKKAFCADAYWRDRFCLGDREFYSPALIYDNAVKYWSGKKSDYPKMELIIPLPAVVL